VSVKHQPAVHAADAAGELVFPGLTSRLNGLKTVVITSRDGEITFEREGKAWVSKERAGYPVDGAKLAALIVQMAQMRKIEAKTRLPQKYDRLNLEDPKKPGSRAKEVVLRDNNGKTLADMIVGKRKFTLGTKENGIYVRLPGQAQTWLASGDIDVGTKPSEWLMSKIADVKSDAIKRVAVTQPDGSKVVAEKVSVLDTDFKITNGPHGTQFPENAGNEFGNLLSDLTFNDVAKAETVPFPKDKITVAEVEGFEGLHVTLEAVEANGATWIRVHAEPPDLRAPQKSDVDWGKVAADINARAEGWVFQIPSYEAAPLKKRMADLVKEAGRDSKP
jgi:hypothetical protein